MNIKILKDSSLKNKQVFVRCTWAAGYTEPVVNRGLRAISYNDKSQPIGTLTGRYCDRAGVYWVEAVPALCNRAARLWFRANDVLPDLTLSENGEKKTNWLLWISAALMALR